MELLKFQGSWAGDLRALLLGRAIYTCMYRTGYYAGDLLPLPLGLRKAYQREGYDGMINDCFMTNFDLHISNNCRREYVMCNGRWHINRVRMFTCHQEQLVKNNTQEQTKHGAK